MLSIGELSRQSGVKVPTIRYYEEIGIIAPATRSDGNQRRYDHDGLTRLAFIKHARDLGFSIDDIRSLIALSQERDQPCNTADKILQLHLSDVRARIEKLQRLERELERMTGCDGHCVADCSVLESLSDHSQCLGPHQ